MALFNNGKKEVWLIIAFVAALITAWATSCHGEEASLAFRAGSTVLRGPAQVIEITWAWPSMTKDPRNKLYDGQWETSVTLIGQSSYLNQPQPNQIVASARYVDGFGPVDLGLGLCALQNDDAYNRGRFNFNLVAGWHHGKHFSIRYGHISNAGTTVGNLGRDMLLFGWKF